MQKTCLLGHIDTRIFGPRAAERRLWAIIAGGGDLGVWIEMMRDLGGVSYFRVHTREEKLFTKTRGLVEGFLRNKKAVDLLFQ